MTTRPPTDPFESELRAAIHRLARQPTLHLLDEVLRATDSMPQRALRWRLFSWPSLAAASAAASVVVIAIGLAGLPRGGFSNRGVAPSLSSQATPSTTAVPSSVPTASPLPAPRPAQVLARIRLPYPDAQTAFDEQVAVTDHAIWTVFRGTHLVQISTITNSVVSDVSVDYPVLAAGGGALWTLGPVGLIPGPDHTVLSRVDLSTGVPHAIARVSPNPWWDAGLGGVWVLVNNRELWLLDGTTGDVLRHLAPRGGLMTNLSIGCDSLWAWRSGDGSNETLQRLDPETGEVLRDFRMPEDARRRVVEIDGSCWTLGDGSIYRLGQDGQVDSSRLSGHAWIAGASVWTIQNDVLQRIEPSTGEPVGTAWRLPAQDVRVDIPKIGVDWQLLSAGGSLWLLRGDELIRYGIAAS